MRIAGYQPVSLLDFPGRVAAIVFTQGCPLRCVYCHNPELLPPLGAHDLDARAVMARICARRLFLDGVVVTGGEPTVHPDLPAFLAGIKALGLETKLDTNGVHPRMVERILKEGLADYVAMDVKHVWERYPEIVGRAQTQIAENCRETLHLLRASGVPCEFRTTVYPALHDVDDLMRIAGYLGDGDRYALQEIRYGVTLRKDLPVVPGIDLEAVAERIRAARPDLHIEVRA
ncbi:MAG TPA: anaerobic ribonucleoside-triphosphate reductase activating protein [Candidatus Baltobacteraceae bacterium]|nr:anaerobic ribonucleoside-triphosphate reductase activating protein [Candidatus Baltobacteraceae bacterium]